MKEYQKSVRKIFIFLLFFLILSVFPLYGQNYPLVQDEIVCEVDNLKNATDQWTVTAVSLSTYRWKWISYKGYLTSKFYQASVSGTGNNESGFSFQSTCSPDGQHDLAFSKYRFTFDLPDDYTDNSIVLDLRDADWSANYDSHRDIWIKCVIIDSNSSYFMWKRAQGGTYSSSMKDNIWEMFGIANGDENKHVLQPTAPKIFKCTNSTNYGSHPHFIGEW